MKKTEVPHLKISASGKNEDNDPFDRQFFITLGYRRVVFICRLDIVG